MDQLVGNERVKGYLKRMIATGHFPHALVFAGPRRAQKFDFALAFAKQLAGPHDIHIFTPEGKGAVHTIESLRHVGLEVALAPHSGERKVFILDAADRMQTAAASALLKTLEEPTPGTLILLVTARRDRLLPTILSRAPTLYFQPTRRLVAGEAFLRRILFESEGDIYPLAEELAAGFEDKEKAPYILLEELEEWLEEALLQFQAASKKEEIQEIFQKTKEAIASYSKLTHCFEFLLLKLKELHLEPFSS